MKTKLFTHKMRKTLVAFAAVCGLLSSTTVSAADLTATVSKDSVESCSVSTTLSSEWSVTIPKHIVLEADSSSKTASGDYNVSVQGLIDSAHAIVVEPETSFVMSNGNKSATATVTQSVVGFSGDSFTLTEPSTTMGNVTVSGLGSGEWTGNFNFRIAEVTHLCNYENGHCTICGKLEPGHTHSYATNGMCGCGEENPDVTFVTFSKNFWTTARVGSYSGVSKVRSFIVHTRSADEQGHTLSAGNCKDVSFSGDGSVVGWVNVTDSANGYGVVNIAPAHAGSVLRAPSDCSDLFYVRDVYSPLTDSNYSGVNFIGLANIDWSGVTNVHNMLQSAKGVSADLSKCNFKCDLSDIGTISSGTLKLPE